MDETPDDVVPKPDELLALDGVTAELFETLQRWFSVPDQVSLDMTAVDSAVTQMSDPTMIAALAMRKLQALNLLATPGVRTTTDMVVTIVQDLDRALVQAPAMRLHKAAESTDWDAALRELEGAVDPGDGGSASEAPDGAPGPQSPDDDDPEADRFRELHGRLHEAAVAVVEASEGRIRYLE